MPKPRHNDRTCIVSRVALAPGDLAIRFVLSPQGILVPDLSEKLPGRGAWVQADRDLLATALQRGAFARALRSEVKIDAPDHDAFISMVAEGLKLRALGRLGLAKKAGGLIVGSDTIARSAKSVSAYLWTADAAPDGVRKVQARLAFLPQENQLMLPDASDVVGQSLGEPGIVHIGLLGGKSAANALWECRRRLCFLGASTAKLH